jgi:hypothetical protein
MSSIASLLIGEMETTQKHMTATYERVLREIRFLEKAVADSQIPLELKYASMQKDIEEKSKLIERLKKDLDVEIMSKERLKADMYNEIEIVDKLKMDVLEKDKLVEQMKLEAAEKDKIVEKLKMDVLDKDKLMEQLKMEASEKDKIVEQLKKYAAEKDKVVEPEKKDAAEVVEPEKPSEATDQQSDEIITDLLKNLEPPMMDAPTLPSETESENDETEESPFIGQGEPPFKKARTDNPEEGPGENPNPAPILCDHRLTTGKRMGKACGRLPKNGTRCGLHA